MSARMPKDAQLLQSTSRFPATVVRPRARQVSPELDGPASRRWQDVPLGVDGRFYGKYIVERLGMERDG